MRSFSSRKVISRVLARDLRIHVAKTAQELNVIPEIITQDEHPRNGVVCLCGTELGAKTLLLEFPFKLRQTASFNKK